MCAQPRDRPRPPYGRNAKRICTVLWPHRVLSDAAVAFLQDDQDCIVTSASTCMDFHDMGVSKGRYSS